MFDSEQQAELQPTVPAVPGRFSALPRPFLRWAGSKQALLPHLIAHIPEKFGRYYEPFLGSGALYFHLKPLRATLSDASQDLIDLYCTVRENSGTLVNYLSDLKPDKELFYKIRENRSIERDIRAAEFLYLNKTCWNGLYRVNSKGKFNVPYGYPRTDFIFDKENLKACSKQLSGKYTSIRNCDFALSLQYARKGDFVYLDPPYVTKHNNNGFRDWNEKLFRWEDQVRLAELANRLRARGVYVVISNANHQDIRDLYKNFNLHVISRSSTLSSNPSFRGRVTELIATANVS